MTGTTDDDGSGLGPPRGVLRPSGTGGLFTLDRVRPTPELDTLVECYWNVRWDLRGLPPREQQVLAHPQLHLVFEQPEARVYGVDRGLFVRRLEGRGQVLGIKFRPGGFRPFWGGPVQELADRVLPAAEVFGEAVAGTNRGILALDSLPGMAALADAFLLARRPAADPRVAEVTAMVDLAAADHGIVRVEQLAARCEVSVRTLQRLFAEYVGVGPKWVLRRFRLQQAALLADAGAVDWPLLAAELGYADQAHLSRDFTAVVGRPPTRYTAGH
ncbi:AraC family transcriptional regulator [Streptacidiphilus sp. P02-A3a]|uniref:helix-turn-helix domain-containing protein n=1 Tax=Streptacidiphilus sp. P02-A3a TaxID=2704468 RepID=UPI0015FE24CF|nr:AraC family transcriptional regulator [Streptacidiphilus sp. P02-A3a]QMU68183.1 AraC family transcriptional regulator [Streptacidiphilus sp. P02-A3a]